MHPLKHIAPLAVLGDDGEWDLAGTTFAFRAPGFMLTAAHCVRGVPPERVAYTMPDNRIVRVMSIDAHDTADIAILRVGDDAGLIGFWDFFGNCALGEDFFTYGFPYEEMGGGFKRLLPRLFHGIYQRIFDYSHGPWRYHAAEISAPAPLGLSGAPLFRLGVEQMITGMVTANVSSELVEDYYEETVSPAGKVVHKTAKITTYGIAVLLAPIREWLNARLPTLETNPKWE